MKQSQMQDFDVVIIGGSYAGLSAALPLLRARKKVLIVDAGQRRNRFAEHSHGFLTQDGTLASEIIDIAKQQLEQYENFHFQQGIVQRVEKSSDRFYVCIDKEVSVQAKRLIIAIGVNDQIAEIDGLTERWGNSIFHCPYCHGYELNQGKIGMLYTNKQSLHVAGLLPDWGNTTLLTNADAHFYAQLDDVSKDLLKNRNVIIDERKIVKITGQCEVIFEQGESLYLDGLFVSSKPRIQAEWIQNLGVTIEHHDFGEFIPTSATKETNIKGIFACGDVARLGGSVPLAVADGNIAGVAAHQSLVFTH